MSKWFYAVMVEDGITWSAAVKASNEAAARRQLARRYPRATIFALEC
jgi:hypothetical protein